MNGNRNERMNSKAAQDCLTNNRSTGPNGFINSPFTIVSNSVISSALCGSGMGFGGEYSIVYGNLFIGNGDHTTRVSDGFTVGPSLGIRISYNLFQDNSDCNLILFGGPSATVNNNQIRMSGPQYQAFTGMMLDNMRVGINGLGDFTNASVISNDINCNYASVAGYYGCDFGMEIGPYPWYTTLPSGAQLNPIFGGEITHNSVAGGRQGINMAGAGTKYSPVNLDSTNYVANFMPSPVLGSPIMLPPTLVLE